MTDASLRGNQLVFSCFPCFSPSPRVRLISHSALVSNNAASRTRELACRVEPVPTLRRATLGLERMGQQHIRHYQHPTGPYRHRRDTHTAHILLVQVCFQVFRCLVYVRIVQYSCRRHDIVICPNHLFITHGLVSFEHGLLPSRFISYTLRWWYGF